MSIPPPQGPGSKVPIRPSSKAPPRPPAKVNSTKSPPTVRSPPSAAKSPPGGARSPTSPRDKRPITPRGSRVSPSTYVDDRYGRQGDVASRRGGDFESPSPGGVLQRRHHHRNRPRSPEERQEELQMWSPPHRGTFDAHDRAPEDRTYISPKEDIHPFGKYDCVVRGSLIIEGLNYAKFQAPMNPRNSENRKNFTTALRDDIIACVGQGVRRKDIMLRAAPGPIRGVILEYDKYKEGSPTLVDADWGIEFEYAIRVRNEVSQQHVAMMLYTSLCEPDGLDIDEARQAWIRYVDPSASPTAIFTSPVENGATY